MMMMMMMMMMMIKISQLQNAYSCFQNWHLVGPIVCPEMSVRNCHYALRKNSEESSSYLLHGGSLKPRKSMTELI
jgi:hypothetical protein